MDFKKHIWQIKIAVVLFLEVLIGITICISILSGWAIFCISKNMEKVYKRNKKLTMGRSL